jgi:ATP-dependent exoDNAse (exonuclease V) beta subunit
MRRAQILSASAGSGKTYQLAYKYVRDVVEHPELYRSILAVTFTNKATEEMKSRILKEIHTLASGGNSSYMGDLCRELSLNSHEVKERALRARQLILHDYSRFTILTLDRFFQRIIRAFIKELGIDLNYNIELDTTTLLTRSADNLVESITESEELKRWLLEFAQERINDGDKWDMRGDLKAMGREIFKERSHERLKLKQSKEQLSDIIERMVKRSDDACEKMFELGKAGVEIMERYGLSYSSFKGQSRSFTKCFMQYAAGELKTPTDTMRKAVDNFGEWYKSGADASVVAATQELQPILGQLCDMYAEVNGLVNTTKLIKENYRSFALLADLYDKVTELCDKENIMVLGETKHILATFINDSNAPFIYEKVGNRFERFMIDEFQDTSVGDWRNMLPLLQNAMASSEDCSVFIVGDVKQSIYRWRGGDWQLLQTKAIEMLGKDNVAVEHLESNYRSLANVVEFNNNIMAEVVARDNLYLNRVLDEARANGSIGTETHTTLYNIMERAYTKHAQRAARKELERGYAEATIYDAKLMESPFIEAIESATARGYRYRDILLLVRNAKDGRRVADALFAYKERLAAEGREVFNILTSDSLTIEANSITEFIIAVFRLTVDVKNDIERGIYNRFLGRGLDHTFDEEELALLTHIAHLSPMEAFEAVVANFKLDSHKEYIAYLQAMHEQVISFTTSRNADIQRYLAWWDERGRNESICVEMTDDTIEITTIHKSKGLERPVVIIPYTQWDISPRAILRPVVWAKATAEDSDASAVGEFPVVYGSTMQESLFSEEYYKEMVMNHVDAVNLLYVALTRASEELYLYLPSRLNTKSSSKDNALSIVSLVTASLSTFLGEAERLTTERGNERIVYRYGTPVAEHRAKVEARSEDMILDSYPTHCPELSIHLPSRRYEEEGIMAGTTERDMGIRLHHIFERAHNVAELHQAIDDLVVDCVIDLSDSDMLHDNIQQAMLNPKVEEWFAGQWDDVKVEAEIITSGNSYRPDRVMIKGDRAVVVDYKFGSNISKSYNRQVERYMELLAKMGRYSNIEGYVWYISLGKVVMV